MLFHYKGIDTKGTEKEGNIDAINQEIAISSLQRRGLVISSIEEAEKKSLFSVTLFETVSNKDVVILSRQIATLFEAQVSALRVFRLLGGESANPLLGRKLMEVSDDLQSGSSISSALSRHPKIFSSFYVNMVRSGEESGKLDETFLYLADYLDRMYEVTSKARNALIYPAFVIGVFITVMVLILTLVIPNISAIILESGQDIPVYTKIVISFSNFFLLYGVFLIILIIIGGFFLWRWSHTKTGELSVARTKLSVPFIGTLYTKLYLSRIADNLSTLLSSGVTMVRALEITGQVVGNKVYENILTDTVELVKGGGSVSDAFSKHEEMPGIMVQMVKVGEETGEVGSILKTLSKFYQREVTNAVDTLIGLIEPVMIILLGLGVGTLLASVLVPIYNLSSAI